MASITSQVAEFIVGASLKDIPAEAIAVAKRSILDALGLAIAGSTTEAASITRDEVFSYGPMSAEATVLGTSKRVPARFAAFVNGVAIHVDDFDDTQLAKAPDRVYGLLTHPSAPVLPVALALGERENLTGSQVLLAYAVGVEVETKLAEAMSPRHYGEGFHTTGTVGTIGAAAAAARALGLTADAATRAIGIASSSSAGLRVNFGTMTKSFHAGRAAEAGVLSAQLARRGFSANRAVLEARSGFFQAFGGGFDERSVSNVLGHPWTFIDPGISIKPYPSGALSHPAMDAFLEMINQHDLKPDDVREIRVGTSRYVPSALTYHTPMTGLEGKFSMEYCLAVLLLKRRAGVLEFTDTAVREPEVQELVKRISIRADPEAELEGVNRITTLIDVRLKDATLHTQASFATGSPSSPMADEAVLEKYLRNVSTAKLSDTTARNAAGMVMELETLSSIATLLDSIVRDTVLKEAP